MPKIFKFTTLSARDLIVTFAPVLLLLAGLSVIAYKIIDPFPPKIVTISTGQENSAKITRWHIPVKEYISDIDVERIEGHA